MDQPESPIQRETRQAQAVMREARFHVTDVALVVLSGLAVLYTLYFAAGIILPLVLALVLGLLLSPLMRLLCSRLRFPRMLAAALLIAGLFSAIGGIGYAISVPAAGWIAKAPESLPTLQRKLSFSLACCRVRKFGFGFIHGENLKNPSQPKISSPGPKLPKLFRHTLPNRPPVVLVDDLLGVPHQHSELRLALVDR